ncbi:MAG: hypothetical protein MZU97_13165 [Bacillus subtilis]|nr:hypothetical protein [Bacillus subtilis]
MAVPRSGYYQWVGRHGEKNRYANNRALLSNLVIAEHKPSQNLRISPSGEGNPDHDGVAFFELVVRTRCARR